MLNSHTPRTTLMILGAIASATIVGALIFEYVGYAPCELCLLQRWPYYAAMLVSAFGIGIAGAAPQSIRPVLMALSLIFLFSAGFGVYHAGVEWKFWAGPDTCSGVGALSVGLPDLSKKPVMCDEPALRIFGLSLAGWNALISFGLASLAIRAAFYRNYGSSSVSQYK